MFQTKAIFTPHPAMQIKRNATITVTLSLGLILILRL